MSIRWKEFLQAAVNAESYTLFRICYRPGITPEMRISYGGRQQDIAHVVDIAERHRELHLMAKDVVAGGRNEVFIGTDQIGKFVLRPWSQF